MRQAARIALAVLSFSLLPQLAQAQTFTTLHAFTGQSDGWGPTGLIRSGVDTFYGTATHGGMFNDGQCANGCGTVFQLKHAGSGWLFTPIYTFLGDANGGLPKGRPIFGPDGALYGATSDFGSEFFGNFFRMQPQATAPSTALVPVELHVAL